MSICPGCQPWFLKGVQKVLFERDAADVEFQVGRDGMEIYKFHSTRSASEIFQNSNSCWFCARIWHFHRRRTSVHSKYYTDEEIFEDINKRSPEASIPLYWCYTHIRDFWGLHQLIKFGSDNYPWERQFELYEPDEKEKACWKIIPKVYKLNQSSETTGSTGSGDLTLVEFNSSSADLRSSHSQKLLQRTGLDPTSPERLRAISDWLSICNDHHDCIESASHRNEFGRILPTRLLDLTGAQETIRLVETANIGVSPVPLRYATLSHCWGSEGADLLIRSNYDDHIRSVRISELNRTNRDAVQLCRSLQIGYLWIDSLCIIQNEPDLRDWSAEAPKMHHVYGNSHLNLAASSSSSGRRGLFRKANPALSSGIEFHIGTDKYHESLLNTVLQFLAPFAIMPLLSRGWVQQELLMAPRVLHFADDQMVWACRHTIEPEFLCELQPNEYPCVYSGRILIEPRVYVPIRSSEISSVNALNTAWFRFLLTYSNSNVTKPEDKYFALAGIASMFLDAWDKLGMKTQLVAGCWTHNMLLWLLWRQRQTLTARLDSGQTYIPSWSWLNCKYYSGSQPMSSAFLNKISTTLVAEVLGMDAAPVNQNLEFGPLIKGHLHIRAPVFYLRMQTLPWWKYGPSTVLAEGLDDFHYGIPSMKDWVTAEATWLSIDKLTWCKCPDWDRNSEPDEFFSVLSLDYMPPGEFSDPLTCLLIAAHHDSQASQYSGTPAQRRGEPSSYDLLVLDREFSPRCTNEGGSVLHQRCGIIRLSFKAELVGPRTRRVQELRDLFEEKNLERREFFLD